MQPVVQEARWHDFPALGCGGMVDTVGQDDSQGFPCCLPNLGTCLYRGCPFLEVACARSSFINPFSEYAIVPNNCRCCREQIVGYAVYTVNVTITWIPMAQSLSRIQKLP